VGAGRPFPVGLRGGGGSAVRARRLRWSLAALAAAVAFWLLPVASIDSPVSPVLLAADGRLLGARIAADEQWRFPPGPAVPERFEQALLAAEDKRFRRHPGVDPLALARAIKLNVEQKRVASGASTLTMQAVRIASGNPARTVPQKLREMVLALRLEAALSKDDILAMYAAHAPFGGNTVGLEAASWRYFGRAPTALSWGEAATLAVLPNNPALVRPGRNEPLLRARRDALLQRLADAGHLDAPALSAARAEPLPGPPGPVPRLAPHLLGRRDRQATTLDRSLQERVREVVLRHADPLAGRGVHNIAALVVDVPTGAVLAYVGNTPSTTGHGAYVDIVRAPRSTGSTLKPLLYEAMLDAGELLPDELVPDVPLRLGGFAPENFDRRYDGALPASTALARSRNVPAVWMLQRYGVGRFADRLRQRGMTTLRAGADHYGLSLILGGAEGTLWELLSMYRGLAHAAALPAESMPPMHWRRRADLDPDSAALPAAESDAAATASAARPDPAAAWATLQALLEVRRPGVHGAWRSFDSGRKVAWKTGTSFGFRDAWALGVTPQVAVGVWVGNHDGEGRAGLTGLQAAAPVLFDLVDLTEPGPWFPPPPGLVPVAVCTHSGQRAGPDCEHTEVRELPAAAQRATACAYCQRIHCDAGCKHRVHADCEAGPITSRGWFVLPPSQAWFVSRRRADYVPPPPYKPGCAVPTGALSVLSPRPGARVFLPRDLDGAPGQVVFEAAHRDRNAAVHWHLDDRFVGTTTALHQVALAPTPGEHTLTLVDAEGSRVRRQFVVLDGG